MEKANNILDQKAVRITPMRQLVLDYFLNKNTVLGLSELEKAFPRSDRITIYRTLKTFEENGILHSIKGDTEEIKYALCDEHCTPVYHIDQHPHFQCLKCKKVSCIESQRIPKIELPEGYVTNNVTMIIKGICPGCQG